jgi:hypothetical protein
LSLEVFGAGINPYSKLLNFPTHPVDIPLKPETKIIVCQIAKTLDHECNISGIIGFADEASILLTGKYIFLVF